MPPDSRRGAGSPARTRSPPRPAPERASCRGGAARPRARDRTRAPEGTLSAHEATGPPRPSRPAWTESLAPRRGWATLYPPRAAGSSASDRVTPRYREGAFMSPRRLAAALALAAVLAGGGAPASAGGVEDGQKALAERRFADAATAFSKALEGAPSSRPAALGLARAAAEGALEDRYDAAEQALRTVLKAKADDREARLALGNLYLARVAQDDRWRADAEEQFQRVLETSPDDADAAVGIARMYWAGGDTKRAIHSIDAFLEKHESAGPALHWKALLLYDEATQAFQREGGFTDDVKKAFQAALAAFQASTKADPSRVDGWIHLGYAAQYLIASDASLRDVAIGAYRKALELDGESDLAMRGLSALYRNDGSKWVEVLDALAKEKPTTPIVLYWYADSLHKRKRLDDAEKAFASAVTLSHAPAAAWFELGNVREEKGDAASAAKAWRKSLEADPTSPRSASTLGVLMKPLYDRMRDAGSDASKAKEIVKEAMALLPLAPRDTVSRNNVGFFAREAFNATKDRALLDA